MRSDHFVAGRKARWEELEQLLVRGRSSGLRQMTGDDVLRLGDLYRAATSDLAIARRDFAHDRITLYLNGLVGRAHPLVYRQRDTGAGGLGAFFRYGFPAGWRQASPYIAVAFGLFLVAAVVSAGLVTWHQSMADVLMPGSAQRLRVYMEQHQLWMKGNTSNHPWAANFIMVNNIQVALIAFAFGIVFGLGTAYEMVQNGIVIGTTGAMIHHYGLDLPFWTFVVGHGVLELSVIFMAGGAGLMMGDALLRPGLRRRRDALPDAARAAARLVCGGAPLLVVAGIIESFLSPSDAPAGLKLGVGVVTGALLYVYLLTSRPRLAFAPYTFGDLDSAGSPSAGPRRTP